VTESRSGRPTVDAIETNGLTMEALHRENLLQAMNPPALADLMPQAVPPHHEWIATRLNIFPSFYNTNLVRPADVPKSYQDLDDPKWKGKLGAEVESIDWFSTVVGVMGEEAGLKLFRDIVSKNGVSVRKGHTLLANLTASGEVPFAITTYEYHDQQLIDEGAPVQVLYLPPVVGLPTGIGLMRNAPHPYAAALFEDFIPTDGQTIYKDRQSYPTNPKVMPPPAGVELAFVDFSKLLDENDKWTKLYKEIFVNQSR
jgi:iron(III) transport system substrate-binding protein